MEFILESILHNRKSRNASRFAWFQSGGIVASTKLHISLFRIFLNLYNSNETPWDFVFTQNETQGISS